MVLISLMTNSPLSSEEEVRADQALAGRRVERRDGEPLDLGGLLRRSAAPGTMPAAESMYFASKS